jgi:hypothetical protein
VRVRVRGKPNRGGSSKVLESFAGAFSKAWKKCAVFFQTLEKNTVRMSKLWKKRASV